MPGLFSKFKRWIGLSSRGSYFPNNSEVAPEDSMLSRSSKRNKPRASRDERTSVSHKILINDENTDTTQITNVTKDRSTKDSLEEKRTTEKGVDVGEQGSSKQNENSSNVSTHSGELDLDVTQSSDDGHVTIITDSLPYRDPSDRSQQFTSSRSSNAVPSMIPEAALAPSVVNSETTSQRLKSADEEVSNAWPETDSSIESVYSTDSMLAQDCDKEPSAEMSASDMARRNPSSLAFENEGGEPVPRRKLHSDASSMCVNYAETPIDQGSCATATSIIGLDTPSSDEDENQTKVEKKEDMERMMKEMNESLDGILSNPAPFQVSHSNLPPMIRTLPSADADHTLEDIGETSMMNNSVTNMLNESHDVLKSSPADKHLRSYGY